MPLLPVEITTTWQQFSLPIKLAKYVLFFVYSVNKYGIIIIKIFMVRIAGETGVRSLKKWFSIAVGLVIALSALLVSYGAFLNYKSEKLIGLRLDNQTLKLTGAKAQQRSLSPVFTRESVRLKAQKQMDATSRLEGTVAEVYVRHNSQVTKGQPLCRIINESIPLKLAQVDVSIAKAQTSLTRYERSYLRYQKLVSMGAVSQEQFDEAENNYKASLEEIKQLQLERQEYENQQDNMLVLAPMDGEVLMLYKRPGNFIAAGSAVALIGDFSKLQFIESISDKDLGVLMPLATERTMQIGKNDLEKVYANGYQAGNKGLAQTFPLHIISLQPAADVPAALREIAWEVDNSSGILEPKLYSNVKITTLVKRTVLAIPKTALLDNSNNSVYVWKQPEGTLELRTIETGAADESYVQVLSGLAAGDIVIISGQNGLKNGMKVAVDLKEEA